MRPPLRIAAVTVSFLLFLTLLASTARPAATAPRGVVPGDDPGGAGPPAAATTETDAVRLDDGSELWFVEMPSPPTADGGDQVAIENDLNTFRAEAASAGLRYRERWVFTTLWNGVSVALRPEDRGKLTRLPGIASIAPVVAVTSPEPRDGIEPSLLTSLSMIGADIAQNELGLTGAGIKVGIIDTGIDYDHADLGGDGIARSNSDRFPNARVVTGYDFVGDAYSGSNEPVPDSYPDDCMGHGTHVAGIVGADGGVRGVAPGVRFGAYRVFGCAGRVASDIVVAALERALADGMQVVNMSLGTTGAWPQDPMAAASDRLVNAGVVVVAAAGNAGADGLYFSGTPAVGKKVISVASFDNTHMNLSAFRITPDQRLVGYLNGAPLSPPLSGSFPMGRSGTRFSPADACAPLPPGSLSGRVALVRRGTCPFETKAYNAQVAGALVTIIYSNVTGFPEPPGPGFPGLATIPVIGITRADGDLIDARLSAGPVTLTWEDEVASLVQATGGLISPFSSFGPSPDLGIKPDLGAPGGFIRSSIPIEQGIYAFNAGTSMAAPHVAGAAALLLQARPNTPSNAVRDILQNNAVPRPYPGNQGLVEAVHRQGAGMIDVPAAVTATTRITPAALSLGEVEGATATGAMVISNESGSAVTYRLSNRPAVSTAPSTFVPIVSTATAAIGFDPNPVTVPPGGSVSVAMTFTPPAALPNRGLFGGYIDLVPDSGGADSHVPYLGFKGDYQSIPVLTPIPQGSPSLAQRTASGLIIRLPFGGTFSMVGSDHPLVLYHLDHPASELKFEVLEADTGRSWHRIDRTKWVRRNTGATAISLLDWDGSTVFGKKVLTVPDGRYVIRLSVLRALAETNSPEGWETWTSPVLTLDRPSD